MLFFFFGHSFPPSYIPPLSTPSSSLAATAFAVLGICSHFHTAATRRPRPVITLWKFLCNCQEDFVNVHCRLCRRLHEEQSIVLCVPDNGTTRVTHTQRNRCARQPNAKERKSVPCPEERESDKRSGVSETLVVAPNVLLCVLVLDRPFRCQVSLVTRERNHNVWGCLPLQFFDPRLCSCECVWMRYAVTSRKTDT